VESGRADCSAKMLANLHRLGSRLPLSLWVLAGLERKMARRDDLDSKTKENLHNDLVNAMELISLQVNPPHPPTLGNFPRGFEPLTVVVGDRREQPLVSRGDLLVGSASPEDLKHILSLGLRDSQSVIRTDKLITNTANQNDLHRVFGDSNLLVVGSPFVNLMARIVNGVSFFPFRATGGLEDLGAVPARNQEN